MARIVAFAVLVVALASVAFGLDWVTAPMSPMPDMKFAVNQVPAAPVPLSQPDRPKAEVSVGYPGSLPPPAAAPARRQTVGAATAASEVPQLACNIGACANAYLSFQASDCTYQPLNGPRRRCSKK